MKPLRVLVVDDSAVNRRTLSAMLEEKPGVTVVGTASDGDEALRLAAQLAPDMITLDLEMPRMDGFTFLRLLMASRPTPVIVVSSHSAKDNVFRALELGAIDFVAKPDAQLTGRLDSVATQLDGIVAMVRRLSPANLHPRRAPSVDAPSAPAAPRMVSLEPPSILVVIGASTGGPTALLDLFARLPRDADASVVVAQHMPERFTKAFAERLDRVSALSVREAEGTTPLHRGMGLVCPGGKCVEIAVAESGPVARVVEASSADRYAPSIDRLFKSAAAVFRERAVGVVLTGMGDDGAQGALAIRRARGKVLAESEETAVIFGMPRSATDAGAVDEALALPSLIERVCKLATAARSA